MESIDPLKHTPGPWEVALYKSCVWIREAKDRKRHPYFVDVFCNEQWPEGKANANLIAAAPDLLEALKALMVDFKETVDSEWGWDKAAENDEIWVACKKAIAKAEPSL